ncbi:enoyl-CoA hydratase/isomerase family protein [Natrarchaeobaculum aegyptiacum]|uniref:Enoyl-CoA hydratase n=1 Tax=Natrarchaeobaculum aegyptiacum TaxID=745377 RepID=A0A2Z2HWT6_9EURY|nr:enoyl-CoA hydratase/isomerase family protein [Natrarchaeobaculum aegyptiacum]ARS90645.1 enoyl-CoA hydratase [Natrarchaeobaculum aegyptiacum]
MVSLDNVEYAVDDGVASIALDRPETLNALDAALLAELEEAIERAEQTDEVRVVVLGGNGRAFSSGYDIGDAEVDRSTDERILDQRTHLEAIFSARVPVIAAVDGPALAGGCNLAICCDLTVATETAEFGYPDMHFGEPPPKFVLPFVTNSLKDARELLYTGKIVDATTASEMGLVNRVVSDGQLDAAIDEEVDHIKKTPGTAVTIAKDMINGVQESQGFRRYGRVDEYVGALTMESSAARQFREIRDEEGLQAALEWVHESDKP